MSPEEAQSRAAHPAKGMRVPLRAVKEEQVTDTHTMELDHGEIQALIDALDALEESQGPLNARETSLRMRLQLASAGTEKI